MTDAPKNRYPLSHRVKSTYDSDEYQRRAMTEKTGVEKQSCQVLSNPGLFGHLSRWMEYLG